MRWMIAGVAMALACTGFAAAEPWSAPDVRMTFDAPAGWTAQRAPIEGRVYVVARAEAKQCHLMIMDRPATLEAPPQDVRDAGVEPLAPAVWERLPAALPRVFGADARLVSTNIDTTGFWPIQFGRYESPTRVVHTAVQFRPGQEFWSFCYADSEAEGDAAVFETLHRSVGATDDAQLQAAIVEAVGDAEARQDAANRRDLERLAEEQRRLRRLGITSPDPAGGNNIGRSGS